MYSLHTLKFLLFPKKSRYYCYQKKQVFLLEVPVAPQGILFCMQAELLVGKITLKLLNGFSLFSPHFNWIFLFQ